MTLPTAVIFDCDGVILQSNSLKSNAFAEVLQGYEPRLVTEFVNWHRATGGVSRYFKFEHFFRKVLIDPDWEEKTVQACADFAVLVSDGLKACDTIPGFELLAAQLHEKDIPMAVNTGGAEDEVRRVFAERGMAKSFQTIFGSPETKRGNMEKLKDLGLAVPGSTYLGDAELDFVLAHDFGLNFIYVAHESEWLDGAHVTQAAGGKVVADLTMLLTGRPMSL